MAENARVLSGFSAKTRGQLVTLIEELAQAARERQVTDVDESAV